MKKKILTITLVMIMMMAFSAPVAAKSSTKVVEKKLVGIIQKIVDTAMDYIQPIVNPYDYDYDDDYYPSHDSDIMEPEPEGGWIEIVDKFDNTSSKFASTGPNPGAYARDTTPKKPSF